MFYVFFSIVLIFCLGCSDSDLPQAFRLDRFRVLALIADQPEVSPGETIMITPFLSDIYGVGRLITFTAEACIDPGTQYGADPTCAESLTRTTLAQDLAVTGLKAPNYTGMVTSTVSCTIPSAAIMFSTASDHNQFNGVPYLVTFVFSFADGTMAQAFRTISVSTKTKKNQNPSYGPVPILGESVLHVDLLDGSRDTYEIIREDGVKETKTEKWETVWYISDGDISYQITDEEEETTYTQPQSPPLDHEQMIVAVTRDGRGGVAAAINLLTSR